MLTASATPCCKDKSSWLLHEGLRTVTKAACRSILALPKSYALAELSAERMTSTKGPENTHRDS